MQVLYSLISQMATIPPTRSQAQRKNCVGLTLNMQNDQLVGRRILEKVHLRFQRKQEKKMGGFRFKFTKEGKKWQDSHLVKKEINQNYN